MGRMRQLPMPEGSPFLLQRGHSDKREDEHNGGSGVAIVAVLFRTVSGVPLVGRKAGKSVCFPEEIIEWVSQRG